MRIKNLLPIGSVVLLHGGEKKLMIIGTLQKNKSGLFKREQKYDYLGVLYPEGHIDDETRFLFNHDSVQRVCFRGYADAEREAFLDALVEEHGEYV